MMAQSAGAAEYNNCISVERVDPPLYPCPGYDTKQSDDEVPVMLGFSEMWSTPSLPSLPGPLGPRLVAPDKGTIYGVR